MEVRSPRLSSAKPTARRFASGQLSVALTFAAAAAACRATPSAPARPVMQADSAPATPSAAPATSAAIGVASATPSTAPSSATGCPDDMVALPTGLFTMSASDKQTPVNAFCIDRTEVTVAAYLDCVRTGACTAAKEMAAVTTHLPEIEREMWAATCNAPAKERALHPMNCVDWNQADAYCRVQHKRLPTEEEWEWAARGGPANNRFPWGDALPTVELLNATDSTSAAFGARYGRDWEHLDGDDGWPTTAPVGSFQKGRTTQGVDDMAGNLWEWTATLDTEDGSRMMRGGSWGDVEPGAFMVGAQRWNDPDKYVGLVGFRCAR